MFSLTNRLRLSWLTLVALAAFALVGALRPAGIDIIAVEFARTAEEFQQRLLRTGETDLAIGTINMLRAQLAADMVFLVAYGLLLGATLRGLTNPPWRRVGYAIVVFVMVTDAVENIFALLVLRRVGEGTLAGMPGEWLTVMNASAVAKWALAAAALGWIAFAWTRQMAALPQKWRRVAAGAIVAAFGVGALGSAATALSFWLPTLRVGAIGALLAPAVALVVQFRLLDTVTLIIRFAVLARSAFIILFLLTAFGPLALGPAANLLGGILAASNFVGVLVTACAAVFLLSAAGTQINIVRAYASLRTGDLSLRTLDHPVLATGVFWAGGAAGLSRRFCVGLASYDMEPATVIVAAVVGASIAVVLLFFIEWAGSRLSEQPPDAPLADTGLPFRAIPWLRTKLNEAAFSPSRYRIPIVPKLLGKLVGVDTGYVESTPSGPRLLPGHLFALFQLLLTAAIYAWVLIGKDPPVTASLSVLQTEREFLVPTIASVLILFLLASWTFGAVAFFIDRYRLALVVAVLIVALLTGGNERHDYQVVAGEDRGDYHLSTPGQVLRAYGNRPLVVASAGGGIQAGAWTARVLEGLDVHLGRTLKDRVALVSAVSGGSMGAMFFGAYLGSNLEQATEQSMKPSLDQVANALISDLSRVGGGRIGPDRGAALEKTWADRLPNPDRDAYLLSRWAANARRFAAREAGATAFPAFLINSTIVETGQPVSFATTQFPSPRYRETFKQYPREYPVVESANRIFRLAATDGGPAKDVGLSVATAARLSAGFPYVSPAVAVHVGAEPYHLVDGGYYDVYGLIALSQWLDDALEEMSRQEGGIQPMEIGVVIARGLVSSDPAVVSRLQQEAPTAGTSIEPARDPNIVNKGWFWQLGAPPVTALNARTFAQWAGDVQVFRLLREKWASRNVAIVPYVFDYPGTDRSPVCQSAPLSWKLTRAQQDCIDKAWDTFTKGAHGVLARVR